MGLTSENDINESAAIEYFNSHTKDEVWNTVLKSSVEECINNVKSKFTELSNVFGAPQFNLKNDECNIKYMSIVTCIELNIYTVRLTNKTTIVLDYYLLLQKCPKDDWADRAECNAIRKFITDCEGDFVNLLMKKITE